MSFWPLPARMVGQVELSDHLLSAVQETMQPAQVSLWLRPTQQTKVEKKYEA